MKLLYVMSITFFLSCFQNEPKFVRKTIDNNDIKIKWFFYSYITSVSPDKVEVEKKGDKKIIFEADGVITNVTLKKDSIILRLIPPSLGIVYTKNIADEVFGYKIILDSSAAIEELNLIPDFKKEY
jgi:hypothetical protein